MSDNLDKEDNKKQEQNNRKQQQMVAFDISVDDDGNPIKSRDDLIKKTQASLIMPLLVYFVRSFCLSFIIYKISLVYQIGFIPILLFILFFPSGRKQISLIFDKYMLRLNLNRFPDELD